MKEILLTQDKIALIDDEDYDLVSHYKWYAQKGNNGIFYAVTTITIPMHQLIIGAKGQAIDHINGDGLNNQKNNLRTATSQENSFNRRKRSGCSSLYKGVCWNKKAKKWRAYLTKNQKHVSLGYFKDEKEAARAYDKAALIHFGSFAKLNFNEGEEK
jgi:hypothetical protein